MRIKRSSNIMIFAIQLTVLCTVGKTLASVNVGDRAGRQAQEIQGYEYDYEDQFETEDVEITTLSPKALGILKTVYVSDCEHPWKDLAREECIGLFLDPTFMEPFHQRYCNETGDLFQMFPGRAVRSYPENGYCASLPFLLCPGIEEC